MFTGTPALNSTSSKVNTPPAIDIWLGRDCEMGTPDAVTEASSKTSEPRTPDTCALVRSRPSVADTRPDIEASEAGGSHGASACSVSPFTVRSTRPGVAIEVPVPGTSRPRGMLARPLMAPPCHVAVSVSMASIAPSKVACALRPSMAGMPVVATAPLAIDTVDVARSRLPRLSHVASTAPLADTPAGTAPKARPSASTSATSPLNDARSG